MDKIIIYSLDRRQFMELGTCDWVVEARNSGFLDKVHRVTLPVGKMTHMDDIHRMWVWLCENCEKKFWLLGRFNELIFQNADDAMTFRLTWG